MEALYTPTGAVAVDEFSQLQGPLLHAASLLATYARSSTFNLDVNAYAEQSNLFGRIAVLGVFGDHLQLPPVPKSTSLLRDLTDASAEHKAGAAMFANLEDVFLMTTAMRFEDPTLIHSSKNEKSRRREIERTRKDRSHENTSGSTKCIHSQGFPQCSTACSTKSLGP
mgnify:CR=1 FL=1